MCMYMQHKYQLNKTCIILHGRIKGKIGIKICCIPESGDILGKFNLWSKYNFYIRITDTYIVELATFNCGIKFSTYRVPKVIQSTCTMAARDLFDLYAQSPRACPNPKGLWPLGFGHTNQTNHEQPWYNYYLIPFAS